MRIAFGLLALLAIGSSADAYGMQTRRPVLNLFRPNVGLVNSDTSVEIKNGSSTSVVPVPADYDGDGKMDMAAWDVSTGEWQIHFSGTDSRVVFDLRLEKRQKAGSDTAVPADYDGDGKADAALWDSSTGEWRIFDGSKRRFGTPIRFGEHGDVPVQADYDGDGKADLATFRATENRWYIRESRSGEVRTENFGIAGTDLLVPADYTGDGKADIAVFRRGTWFVINSETGETEPFEFGFADSMPAAGDYDGDGQIDFAVYRSGTWYVYESSTPRFLSYKFGCGTDVPVSPVMPKQTIAGMQ